MLKFGSTYLCNEKFRDIALLLVAVLLSRWFFRTTLLVHFDSINFVLGMLDYNPVVHQPHPPGYFLYVLTGRLLHNIAGDPVLALVIISIIASMAAAVFIYLLAHEWFGRSTAIFSGVLFLVSPFTWFYGTIGLTYIVEFFFSALIGFLCWHISMGRSRLIIPAALAIGLAVGFRQSSIVIIAPLFIYSIRHVEVKYLIAAAIVFVATISSWLMPMLLASGGSEAYFIALNDLWKRVGGYHTFFSVVGREGWLEGGVLIIQHIALIVTFFVVTFTLYTPVLLMKIRPLDKWTEKKLFALIWAIPGLLFFLFMYIRYSNIGYLAAIFPPFFILIAAKASLWCEQSGKILMNKVLFISGMIIVNTLVFLYIPFYTGHKYVRSYENEILTTRDIIKQSIDPSDTLIIAIDSTSNGFREAGYYSPDYQVMQYPEMHFSAGIKVFAMRNRKTVLLDKLPLEKYSKFIIFPTPRYEHIQEELWGKFPPGSVKKFTVDNYAFIQGEISELKYLFPNVYNQ